jgi:phenylacetate-CoA ligase
MMFWDREIETLSRPELETLQLQRLQQTVQRVARNVPFYREMFAAAGVKPEQIRTLDDVRRLPFTTGSDLRAVYPDGMLAVRVGSEVRLP